MEIGIKEAEKSHLKKHSDIRFNSIECMTHVRLDPRLEAVKTLLLRRLTVERKIWIWPSNKAVIHESRQYSARPGAVESAKQQEIQR